MRNRLSGCTRPSRCHNRLSFALLVTIFVLLAASVSGGHSASVGAQQDRETLEGIALDCASYSRLCQSRREEQASQDPRYAVLLSIHSSVSSTLRNAGIDSGLAALVAHHHIRERECDWLKSSGVQCRQEGNVLLEYEACVGLLQHDQLQQCESSSSCQTTATSCQQEVTQQVPPGKVIPQVLVGSGPVSGKAPVKTVKATTTSTKTGGNDAPQICTSSAKSTTCCRHVEHDCCSQCPSVCVFSLLLRGVA